MGCSMGMNFPSRASGSGKGRSSTDRVWSFRGLCLIYWSWTDLSFGCSLGLDGVQVRI